MTAASTTAANAITITQLSRRYGDRIAVDGLDLSVGRGEIFGFLGPNGAGKTTTIMMLLGILRPTSGSVTVLGQEMTEGALSLKARIGVVAEHQSLYGDMTTDEYLGFFASLYSVANARRRIGELLDALDLGGRRRSRVKALSRGMQQKLGLARALLHSPELLVMDEPASGLDPHGIHQMRQLIFDHRRDGGTAFLSSHILSEVEQTADRVAIVSHGRIVSQGSMADIRATLAPMSRYAVEYEGSQAVVEAALGRIKGLELGGDTGARLLLTIGDGRDARAEISRAVIDAGGVVLGLSQLEISLEEAFLSVTDETDRDSASDKGLA